MVCHGCLLCDEQAREAFSRLAAEKVAPAAKVVPDMPELLPRLVQGLQERQI